MENKEEILERKLRLLSKNIEEYQSILLTAFSSFHAMKEKQAKLQKALHKLQRERRTTIIPPKHSQRRIGGQAKILTIPDALAAQGWTKEAITIALHENPSWREKEVRI